LGSRDIIINIILTPPAATTILAILLFPAII
jgi:hypothetical protein